MYVHVEYMAMGEGMVLWYGEDHVGEGMVLWYGEDHALADGTKML